jgi:hypothetical protein
MASWLIKLLAERLLELAVIIILAIVARLLGLRRQAPTTMPTIRPGLTGEAVPDSTITSVESVSTLT